MSARDITVALRGRWHGSYGTARCPAHDDRNPSLSVAERDGRLLVRCHSGCEQTAVIDALKGRGLWPSESSTAFVAVSVQPTRKERGEDEDNAARTRAALEIWMASQRIGGTLAETYLRTRGIVSELPLSLRFNPALKHGPSGLTLPALVAAVRGPDDKITAIHRTFLKPDGSGKADVMPAKMALGPMGHAAVRLGDAGKVLCIAEGIETALSASQIFYLPTWAACGARLDQIAIPENVRRVVIFADNGKPGLAAAAKAAKAYAMRKRRIDISAPPKQFGDWNDALRAGGSAWAA